MPNHHTARQQEPDNALHDWRVKVLDMFLPIAAIAILPLLVKVVLQWLNHPEIAWQGVAIFVFFYLVLVYTTIRRDFSATTRSWVVIALVYFTGVVSMARGGLAGDGTIYLTVLPILAITLVNVRIGIIAAGVSIATFALFGVFAYFSILDFWLITDYNAQKPEQWVIFGLALGTLIIVTVFVVARFSIFQIETLKSVQKVSQELADVNKQLEQKVRQRTEELSNANQHLHFLATHDNLTGLPNRVLFFDRLDQAVKKSRRQKQRFGLFFIDLDNFKRINDSYGHNVGDQVLQAVGAVLNDVVRDSDTVARLAGDEFTIILDNVQSVENVEMIAQKTIKAISQPIDIPQGNVVMTISLGISIFPENGEDAETLLRNADAAMYQVKDETKNSYQFYLNEED